MLKRILDFLFSIFPKKRAIDELCSRLDADPTALKSVPIRYHEFEIEKRSGRPRTISAPCDELKAFQRKLNRRLFAKLKSHPSATGFKKGVSFVDNAKCHEWQEVIIRIDLVEFFPSIKYKRLFRYFRLIGWNRRVARRLADLVTYQGSLPQGAPTSPILSNLINYVLDCELCALTEKDNGIYTRYADDITISFTENFDLHWFIADVMRIIRKHGYTPHIGRKFDVRRRHQRQVVTGLVVNETAKLSREKRRWLRAVQHRFEKAKEGGYLGPRPTITQEQLEGWNGLQNMIEQSS